VTERLEDRLARLDRERQDADRRYNEALTALDRALTARPDLPAPPPPYDASRLPEANITWDVPAVSQADDSALKGRLRRFIGRLMAPALDAQRHFNATIVDHLNRNVASHHEAQRATDALIARLAEHADSQIHFQSRLLHLLQTVTAYVDTRDRRVGGGHDILNAGLSTLTDDWLKRWESLQARENRILNGQTSTLAAMEDLRATATLAQLTSLSLKRDVEALFAAPRATPPTAEPAVATHAPTDLDSFKYLGFEDQFRGSPENIAQRQREYVSLFATHTDILDVGCGRGEFLELLQAHGVSARGIDLNHAMVEEARSRGLDVAEADALTYLAELPDASLGGLFAAQVVEHLTPSYLSSLLETAAHKIRPGGLIVLETINPACWAAFFESYIRDLTHVRPLHPDTMQYLVRVSGFHDVRIEYKSPIAETDRLQPVRIVERDVPMPLAEVIQIVNENIEKLNGRLFTFQDYAVVGRR